MPVSFASPTDAKLARLVFFGYYRQGQAPRPANNFLGDVFCGGWLDHLEHGRYRLSLGTDTGAHFAVNRIDGQDEVTLVRADSLPLTLPPKTVTIIELQQLEELEPVFRRADLALAAREIEIRDGQIHGVVHNLGGANVDEVVVAIVDASGKVLQRQSLGALPPPLDLIPIRRSFTLPLPGRTQAGWRRIVDPEQRICEVGTRRGTSRTRWSIGSCGTRPSRRWSGAS